jgi:uncharacterized protein YhdP
MATATLEPQGEPDTSLRWVRRTVLVVICLFLLALLAVVFTRVIAARVPEQRATLEKLITERTGLAVRFDNVHFAWGLDGTSAVFERVELTDPVNQRVRVVAPELRVEFDSWDFLRHQQFSLGHVTLSSPDIDIIADEPASSQLNAAPAGRRARQRRASRVSTISMMPGSCGASPPGPRSCPSAASRSRVRASACCVVESASPCTASR